ncbi:putative sporulation protein YtxC [Clostridium tarantellae]|uniref:Putative sporulation protein YtxC n=1 Tax=Clostridium tarantellae TaxID=39493 RepID=A0A6I1MJQ1_9CLOT|nr:putative sporulation protein YtxC [Clostridium tarantellae]MPQ42638.1 putative sporulation protein YtxC [Clostridium tarantellae]
MLLMKVAYEGEQNFIEDIQELRALLKSKGVIIGISESIESYTHFIKIFCNDDNYNENIKSKICLYVSNIIYKIVIDAFRKKEMLEYLTENYFFLRHDEMIEIDKKINKILLNKEKVKNETNIYCLNRINNIIESIKEFIIENNFINITGFITFRMKFLVQNIENIIDKIIEEYMVEKEYNEFIKLLKYFVDIQECKINEINLIVQGDGAYELKDDGGKDIFKVFLTELSSNPDSTGINMEDIIISGLITNAPKKIKIFNEKECLNKEFLQTIKSVFGQRVEICN